MVCLFGQGTHLRIGYKEPIVLKSRSLMTPNIYTRAIIKTKN